MSSIKGFDFKNEKLNILLERFERGQMSLEVAQQLKTLLEPLYRRALDEGNRDLARMIANILMALKGFLSGRISL